MVQRLLLCTIMLTLVFLQGCAVNNKNPRPSTQPVALGSLSTSMERPLPPVIRKVVLRGALRVEVDSREGGQHFFRARGNAADLENINVHVDGQTLYIENSREMGPPVSVYLRVSRLQEVYYAGQGYLSGHLTRDCTTLDVSGRVHADLGGERVHLQAVRARHGASIHLTGVNTSVLNVNAVGNSNIELVGVMGLRQLRFSGSGRVKLYWVDSPAVQICGSGDGQAFVAGVTELLGVELRGCALLDARYLRARKAFVKTHNFSTAEVTVRDSLNALALDHSNIYYYRYAGLINEYMYDRGSVLYMGRVPPCCTVPFCPPMPLPPG